MRQYEVKDEIGVELIITEGRGQLTIREAGNPDASIHSRDCVEVTQ